MTHVLEFFGDGCRLCEIFLAEVRSSKCSVCELQVHDTRRPATRDAVRRYDVNMLPTLIVDEHVKVEGSLDGRWICQGPFAATLERKFPLVTPVTEETLFA